MCTPWGWVHRNRLNDPVSYLHTTQQDAAASSTTRQFLPNWAIDGSGRSLYSTQCNKLRSDFLLSEILLIMATSKTNSHLTSHFHPSSNPYTAMRRKIYLLEDVHMAKNIFPRKSCSNYHEFISLPALHSFLRQGSNIRELRIKLE